MFGMLFGSLSPVVKLRTAVENKMLDSVVKLLEESDCALINTPLYTENRRTALHLACEKGDKNLVQILIDAGADANAMDLFGLTPLTLALRTCNEKCAQLILQNSSWHPETIWHGEENISGMLTPRWTSYSEDILCFMVIGTPNLLLVENLGQTHMSSFMELCERYQRLMKAFYLTGNQLPMGHVLQLYLNSANLGQWIRAIQGVQPLQHYARNAVRRSLNKNVFYGAQRLPIPGAVQKYLYFADEMPL